jgi:hypothetical protein
VKTPILGLENERIPEISAKLQVIVRKVKSALRGN